VFAGLIQGVYKALSVAGIGFPFIVASEAYSTRRDRARLIWSSDKSEREYFFLF